MDFNGLNRVFFSDPQQTLRTHDRPIYRPMTGHLGLVSGGGYLANTHSMSAVASAISTTPSPFTS